MIVNLPRPKKIISFVKSTKYLILINDFLKILDLSDEYANMAKGEADTLAGFLLEIKGEFPVKGEKIN